MQQGSWFQRLQRVTLTICAVILVLFALTVSLVRGLLPQLDEVREQVAQYLLTEYQLKVDIGQLQAQWQAYGPALTVTDLSLPQQAHLPFELKIKQASIKLDFWESLFSGSAVVENVSFSGVDLTLNLDQFKSNSQANSNFDWLYALLLEQLQRFSINDAVVRLHSRHSELPPIHIRDLFWRNLDLRHQAQGVIYLAQDESAEQKVSLSVDLHGDGYHPDSIKGQFYVDANSLDLGKWASHRAVIDDTPKALALEGIINLNAWVSVNERHIESGLLLFEPSWLSWKLANKTQKFSINGGAVEWLPKSDGWQVMSHQLDFSSNGKAWPELNLALKNRHQDYFGYINQIDIQQLAPLIPLIPGEDLASIKWWQQLAPKGIVGPIHFYDPAKGSLAISSQLEQLDWHPTQAIPGISGLAAKIIYSDNHLWLTSPKQALKLSMPSEFRQPLNFTAEPIKLSMDFERNQLEIGQLELNNKDLAINAQAKIGFAEQASLALLANVKVHNVAHVGRYLPHQAMGTDLADYLADALRQGHTNTATVLWHGNLTDYPYQDHSGIFQADFDLQKAQFSFQPDWPIITDINLHALFENTRMDLKVKQGKLMQVPINGAHIYIPDMGEKTLLKVQADLNTRGQDATAVLQASPLRDSVGETLAILQVKGAVQGSLDIGIPFYDGASEDIRGQVKFNNNPIYVSQRDYSYSK